MVALTPQQQAVAFQISSLLLRHPDEARPVLDGISEALAGLPAQVRAPLGVVVEHLRAGQPGPLAEHYTEVFDFTRMCSMYLTYFKFGDTRQRGAALVRFTAAYRQAGLELDTGELPDYLPLVLEFAATADLHTGSELLASHRASIDVLRDAVASKESPYASVLEAIQLVLPPATARDTALAAKLRADGPPTEDVGLGADGMDPYSIDPALLAGAQG